MEKWRSLGLSLRLLVEETERDARWPSVSLRVRRPPTLLVGLVTISGADPAAPAAAPKYSALERDENAFAQRIQLTRDRHGKTNEAITRFMKKSDAGAP